MTDYSKFVNTFLGVDGLGNCLCGPYLPFSIVRLSPDSTLPQESNGYRTNARIIRFSHTHVAGTGGSSRYGNIGFLPFEKSIRKQTLFPFITYDSKNSLFMQKKREFGQVGYYCVEFVNPSIIVELTSTRHCGYHSYQYKGLNDAFILIDIGSVLQNSICPPGEISDFQPWESVAKSQGGFIKVTSDREVLGKADIVGGWGHNNPYSVYFYAIFNKSIKSSHVYNSCGVSPGQYTFGEKCRTVLSFGRINNVEVQVGISFVSIANAKEYCRSEIDNNSFKNIVLKSKTHWNKEFSKIDIQVNKNNRDKKNIFYSMMYRLLCMPTDLGINEENPFWKSPHRNFTDFYCLWDSIRNANSLFNLYYIDLAYDICNALLDIAENTGWLPDSHTVHHHGFIQGGCSADVLFCEAALKNIGALDFSKAIKYMKKNSDVPSPDPLIYGRYSDEYNHFGYVPSGINACVSRTIEYSYHDFCIARLSHYLGATEDARIYYEKSKRLWNLWNDNKKIFCPKDESGNWVDFNPDRTIPDSWNDPFFYEANAWCWSLCVFHDIYGLIDNIGGKEEFSSYIDRIFDKGWFSLKETKMHIPYLYVYCGKPYKTYKKIRELILSSYKNSNTGIPDNEDMGCQSAFFICSSIGLYPIMGQDIYIITSPLFEDISIKVNGGILRIKTDNDDPNFYYIDSVIVNGKSINRSWIRHCEIAYGGTVDIRLSDRPTDFGLNFPPPSPLDEMTFDG